MLNKGRKVREIAGSDTIAKRLEMKARGQVM